MRAYFQMLYLCLSCVGSWIEHLLQIEATVLLIITRLIYHYNFLFTQMQWNHSTVFLINDLLILTMFFICRILVFPFMYYAYGRYKHLQLWLVPSNIPLKCNLGCLFILILQSYWFSLILSAARRRTQHSIPIKPMQNHQPVQEVMCNNVQKEK